MEIIVNEKLLRKMVRCIDKANAEDVPDYLSEHSKETNNALPHLRGDYINENLKRLVVNDNVIFVPFKRYAWQGRIIADTVDKVTYTVTTKKTLDAATKKKRNTPYFLQSILAIENGGYEAPVKQLTLMNMYPFEEDILQADYNDIMSNIIDPSEGYRHYIIAYEAEGRELINVELLFLDKDFDVIKTESLNQYIVTDFAQLTNSEPVYNLEEETKKEKSKSLLKLKVGLKPKVLEEDKQA